MPLLREWLQPFGSMGANSVVSTPTGGTDHVFMQAVGIPGYQFIQDPLDYRSRVHHSSVDTFDHLKAQDLRQASVVLAGVLLQAANSAKTRRACRCRPRARRPTRSRRRPQRTIEAVWHVLEGSFGPPHPCSATAYHLLLSM